MSGARQNADTPRLVLLTDAVMADSDVPTSRSAFSRRGPVQIVYSRAAGRRVPRSAPLTPRGSGRSRRAGLQRQTRPEAPTQDHPRFQAVAWGPETTPAFSVETVGNSWFVNAGAARFEHSSGDVGMRLYAVASGPPTPKRSDRPDLRGGAVKHSGHDDLYKPPPALNAIDYAGWPSSRDPTSSGSETHGAT
jgi:hypothetical protein